MVGRGEGAKTGIRVGEPGAVVGEGVAGTGAVDGEGSASAIVGDGDISEYENDFVPHHPSVGLIEGVPETGAVGATVGGAEDGAHVASLHMRGSMSSHAGVYRAAMADVHSSLPQQ